MTADPPRRRAVAFLLARLVQVGPLASTLVGGFDLSTTAASASTDRSP